MIGRGTNLIAGGLMPMSRLLRLVAGLMLAGTLLISGFAGTASAAGEYNFWQFDGCRYTWGGAGVGWQQGLCGRTDQVGWGRGAAAHQWYHFDGNGWRFQGIFSEGTMDTPNGIFIVPFVSDGEDHIFVYDYTEKGWYHFRIVKQSVQAVPNPTLPPPELETTSGWRPITDFSDPALGTMVREWQSVQDDIIAYIPA